jgi:glycerol-3-phosphate cytidylyltransferase-like family protein
MNKEKVVFTSGSWDMFHVGHLNVSGVRESWETG